MSFFDVFSGAPYGSDFLILTKGIIKKVPKRSAKKYVDYSNSFADCVSWHAKAVIRGLYFERAFCFCVFRTAYEEMKLNEFLNSTLQE